VESFWQYFSQNIGPWLSQTADNISEAFKYVIGFIAENPADVQVWYTEIVRWIMPFLALGILLTVLKSMLKVKNPDETWAYLVNPAWGNFAIHHWECTVGRAKNCDIVVNFPTISRMQWALSRDDEGEWMVADLSGKGASRLNGEKLTDYQVITDGDILSVGDVEFGFSLISEEENKAQIEHRLKKCKPLPPWKYLVLLTIFQVLTAFELMLNCPDDVKVIGVCFWILIGLMWFYVLVSRAAGAIGFEPEVLVFFLCTIGLAITASSAPESLPKQTFCLVAGFILFLGLGWYLRDLNRVMNTRKIMAIATVVLLLSSIILGPVTHGAKNWISIFGMSVQPSELAKITFIFAGAASLDLLFNRKNLLSFILLSFACFACLGLMSDFGTALIFFVTFLVIAYLRSGDFATLGLICGGAAAGGGLILKFKPYIAERFAIWGHAWQNASTTGFQQVRTMSAAASGGLIGVGAGCGWLKNVFAANTDLVFGMVCEEWGLIIALLTLACIVCLAIFAVRVCRSCRSAYYTIAACAATSLLVFQTMLNVFGSLDILPLTGVTFPFVSCGGSSMIACWGLMAFLKAADTRQNASFAVRRKVKTGEENRVFVDVDESILQDEDYVDALNKKNKYRRADKNVNLDASIQKNEKGFFKRKNKNLQSDYIDSGMVNNQVLNTKNAAHIGKNVTEADLESFVVPPVVGNGSYDSKNDLFKKENLTINNYSRKDFSVFDNKIADREGEFTKNINQRLFDDAYQYEKTNRNNAKKVHFDPDQVKMHHNPFGGGEFHNPYIDQGNSVANVDENMLTDEDYIEELLKRKGKGGK
jgi:cell division protein FtsW